MGDRRAVLLLIAIMMAVTLIVGGAAITVLYDTAFDQKRADLVQTVLSQARLMEAVARFDRKYGGNYPTGVSAATLSQIRDAHARYRGFGKTGEFTLARRVGNQIRFVLRHRHHFLDEPDAVPFSSKLAEPMRRALSGQSGTVVGLDYRGVTVVAAYEPVAILNLGIVAKIDLAEVRAPFLWAGGIVLVVALSIIAAGTALFFRVTNPMVARLRESEERYEFAVRGTSDGIWDLNVLTDEEYLSDRWKELLGFAPDELPSAHESFTSRIHPDDYERAMEAVRAHLEDRKPYHIEVRLRTKSGGYRWFLSRGQARWDKKGKPLRMAGSISDITERKQAEDALQRSEEALRESEAKLRAVLDATPLAIIAFDRDDRVDLWTGTAEQMFGWRTEETVGGFPPMIPESEKHNFRTTMRSLRETGKLAVYEAMRTRKDGSQLLAKISIGAMYDSSGTYIGSLGVAEDITERRQLEEELQQSRKMEAVGKLTGGIAHDFNNLLFVIQGNLELLEEETTLDTAASTNVRAAQDAAERAAELTRRLLAYSRKQPLNPETIDLNGLLGETARLLERTLGASVAITVRRAKKLPPIHVDSGQLENAILNLAINARDAMPKGGKLVLETKVVEFAEPLESPHGTVPAGRYVRLTVKDDGEGMAPETVAQAFDPFFTTKDVGEGSGLGLSMVYGFVRQSGGYIRLHSKAGSGTSVELYFPPTEKIKKRARDGAAELVGGEEAILLVEDDDEVRTVATSMLTKLGYRVVAASDGPQALTIAKKDKPFDLLLTDVMLPGGLSGPDLAKKIRRRHKRIKLLYISGYSGDYIKNLVASGADTALLTKPFRRRDLARAVRAALL